jgi:CheY-like chemotaxis protein
MLSGVQVVLVEDDPLVAETIEAMIVEAEGEVAAIAASLRDAQQILKRGTPFDLALLDVNLHDGHAMPLFESLRARLIPAVVYSGAELPQALRVRHPELRVLRKPVIKARLIAELRRALGKLPA